jgi:uncharacterized protein (TIGR02145 family)
MLLASCGDHVFLSEEPEERNSNADETTKYAYCVFFEQEICSAGSFEFCEAGGMLSNSCPYSNRLYSSSSNVYTAQGDKGNDINNYKTVKIGNQTWMAENLNYKIGKSLCYGENGVIYNYNPEELKWNITLPPEEVQANCDKYGRLYDWATTMALDSSCNRKSCVEQVQIEQGRIKGHRGICPEGWHIPTLAEFDTLVTYIKIDQFCKDCADDFLKARNGWIKNDLYDLNGYDAYDFAALPAGDADWGYGEFRGIGRTTQWWTTSEVERDEAASYDIGGGRGYKYYSYSIRCVKDYDGGINNFAAGDEIKPDASLESSSSNYSALVGRGRDINNYKTVKIGSQTWMAENLDYPAENSKCHNNEPYYCEKYGRLYDWHTAMDLPYNCFLGNCDLQEQVAHQGICPDGWHIPSDFEWDIFIAFVHSDNRLPTYYFGDSPYAGKYLKAKGGGWRTSYPGIVNEDKYEFAALPNDGKGFEGSWWTATSYIGDSKDWTTAQYSLGWSYTRHMYDSENSVDWDINLKTRFFSIRCLKD